MTRKMVTGLLIPLMLAACVSNQSVDEELACRNRIATLRHGDGFMEAYPPHLDMCIGYTLRINLRPRVPVGDARSVAATGGPEWLNRSNMSTDQILITIPDSVTVGETYKFGLAIEGVGTLDPYIRIIR